MSRSGQDPDQAVAVEHHEGTDVARAHPLGGLGHRPVAWMVRGSRFMISATVMDTDSSLLSPACPSGELLPTGRPATRPRAENENRTGPGRRPRALRRCSSWARERLHGDRALAVALDLRAAPRRTPACVHVVSLADHPVDPDAADWEQTRRQAVAEHRHRVSDQLADTKVGWGVREAPCEPAAELAAVAEDRAALYIIVGTRGRAAARAVTAAQALGPLSGYRPQHRPSSWSRGRH